MSLLPIWLVLLGILILLMSINKTLEAILAHMEDTK